MQIFGITIMWYDQVELVWYLMLGSSQFSDVLVTVNPLININCNVVEKMWLFTCIAKNSTSILICLIIPWLISNYHSHITNPYYISNCLSGAFIIFVCACLQVTGKRQTSQQSSGWCFLLKKWNVATQLKQVSPVEKILKL